MKMKKRSIRSQLIYALKTHQRFGQSKHLDRLKGIDTSRYVYSYRSNSDLKIELLSLADFIQKNHPEISNLNELNDQILQEYICLRFERFGRSEFVTKKSLILRMCRILNDCSSNSLSYFAYEFYPSKRPGNRSYHKLTREEFSLINAHFLNLKSCLRLIPFITYTIGTRIEEACSIRPDDIDIKKKRVLIRNTKNARKRTIRIDSDFVPGWNEIKKESLENHRELLIYSQTDGSAKRDFPRLIRSVPFEKEIGPISNHDIRKLYARRRLVEELTEEFNIDRAWSKVQVELGHGRNYRGPLMKTYIGLGMNEFRKIYNHENFYELFK